LFTAGPAFFGGGGAGGAGDPLFAYVKSLLHFDDGNGSTAWTDVKGVSWGGTGNTESTAQAKFGTGSMQNGAISTASFPALGTGRFCIEGWCYWTSTSTRGVFDTALSSSPAGLAVGYESADHFQLYHNGTATNSSTFALPVNTWTAWCAERDGAGVIRVMINGTPIISVTDTSALGGFTKMAFGAYYNNSFPLVGFMDEVRVTIGQPSDRYGGAYTPATAPFPNHA
jgi:hypothetical protein